MKIIADLHLHSKYSRAVSSQMNLTHIANWAAKKGIDLIGTGDFTHPIWLRELEANLEEDEKGIYKLKNPTTHVGYTNPARFLLTTEISSIYKDKGKVRRIHTLLFLPSFADVHEFCSQLIKRGCNIFSDGRPIIGLSVKALTQIALEINPKALIIPAHAWTPWFGYYGSFGGYDSLDEGFEDLSKYIYAIETGLSSDPAMNWKIEELKDRQIISFGDAHSGPKLGREATIFNLPSLTYENIWKGLKGETKSILSTIEFYPEEGKYHYSGHAKCNIVLSPNEIRKKGPICPVCTKPLTIGVASRVEHLAKLNLETKSWQDQFGVRWIRQKDSSRPAYAMLVPLLEILSEVLSVGVGAKKVVNMFDAMIEKFGSEFKILLETPIKDIQNDFGSEVGEAISKVRSGDIVIEPGFDGIFGKVKIWQTPKHKDPLDQVSLF